MTPDDWQQKGTRVRFDGRDIFVAREGTGTPLLLIHGFPTSSYDWKAQWTPFLDAGYELIAPDLLGFGFSDKTPTADYTMTGQADMIEAVMSEFQISACHILAHDYGDTVAQELLAREIEKTLSFSIQSLCFLNGGLFPRHHRPRPIQKLMAGPIGPLLTRFLSFKTYDKGLRSVFGPATQPSEAEMRYFWELYSRNNGHSLTHKLLSYIAQRREHEARWVGALLNTDIPLRLIDGVLDPVSGGHLADYYERTVPNADVIRLNVGHYPQVEAPDDVTREVLAFFEDSLSSA